MEVKIMDIITTRLSPREINLPEWAKDVASSYSDSQLIRKGIATNDFVFVEGERAAIFVATSATVDRDREIVVPKGISFKNFELAGRPIQWAHRYDQLSLGSAQWIKYDSNTNRVLIKVKFGKHQFASDVFEHIKEHPLSMSIGFIPVKILYREDFDTVDFKELGVDPKEAVKANRIFVQSELLEASIVPIPANPEAYQVAVSKGLFTQDDIKSTGYVYQVIDLTEKDENDGNEKQTEKEESEPKEKGQGTGNSDGKGQEEIEFDLTETEIIEKPETTENYHRIPVSEGHSGHTIRTVTIFASRGIKALYCVDCKIVITYLFSVDKWTMEEARQWVADHRKPNKSDDFGDVGFGEVAGDDPNPIDIDFSKLKRQERELHAATEEIVEVNITPEMIRDILKEEPELFFDIFQDFLDRHNYELTKRSSEVIDDISEELAKNIIDESADILFGIKSGRTLSSRTRNIIAQAISVLNELLTNADREDSLEEISIESEKDVSLDEIELVQEDDDKLEQIIQNILHELFSKFSIDPTELVQEAIKKYQGKMF